MSQVLRLLLTIPILLHAMCKMALAANKGQICLYCTETAAPTDCDSVVQCGQHEKCFVDTFVNSRGGIRFKLGCRDSRQCDLQTPLIGKRSDTLLVCSECCNDTVCNSAGCGYPGYQKNGGPVCFTCEDQLSESDCSRISLCGTDEICKLQKGLDPVTHTVRYHSYCEYQQKCYNEVESIRKVGGTKIQTVGNTSFASIGDHCILSCCSTSLCNAKCGYEDTNTTSLNTTPTQTVPSKATFNNSPPTETKTYVQSTQSSTTVTEFRLDTCLSNPCRRGICSEYRDTYRCTCDTGFWGRDCEHEAFPHTPVPPKITSPTPFLFATIPAETTTTTAPPPTKTIVPVTSTVPSTTLDPCLFNPCRYGTCSHYFNTYRCTCVLGFWGRDCEHGDTLTTTSPSSTKISPVSTAGVASTGQPTAATDAPNLTHSMTAATSEQTNYPPSTVELKSTTATAAGQTSMSPSTVGLTLFTAAASEQISKSPSTVGLKATTQNTHSTASSTLTISPGYFTGSSESTNRENFAVSYSSLTTREQCVDTISNCDEYDRVACTEKMYRPWANKYCRYFCGFCTTATTTPATLTTTHVICKDKIPYCNYLDVDGDLCTSELYKQWAPEYCIVYCGFSPCDNTTSATTQADILK